MTRDIIEMRIRQLIMIEKNAIDVYTDLEKLIDDTEIQKVFEMLIIDKRKHLKLLGEILSLVQAEYATNQTSPSGMV